MGHTSGSGPRQLLKVTIQLLHFSIEYIKYNNVYNKYVLKPVNNIKYFKYNILIIYVIQ